MANAPHKHLADFPRPFNGVATRVDKAAFCPGFLGPSSSAADQPTMRMLVSRKVLSGGYEATVRDIFAEPKPRWGLGSEGLVGGVKRL